MLHEEVHIDFSFLDGISNTDNSFKRDVIDIFLANTPDGVKELQKLVEEFSDWNAIYKQAHLLKSSFSVIRIGRISELLLTIETLAKKEEQKEKIIRSTAELVASFSKALPVLKSERDNLSI